MIHTLSPSPDLFIKNQPSDWHKDGRERTRKSLQQIVSGDGSGPNSSVKAQNHWEVSRTTAAPRRGQPAKRLPATGTVPVRGPWCVCEECPSDPESKQGQTPGFGCATEPCLRRGFFLAQALPNASRSTRKNDATATPAAAASRFSARRFGDAMRALSIHLLILARLVANDGIFLDKRRMPQRTRSREVNAAIQRTWRRGGRPPSGQSADRPHQIWCT